MARPTAQFKVNDRLIVTGDTAEVLHCFETDAEVIVHEVKWWTGADGGDKRGWGYRCLCEADRDDDWWVHEEDLKPVLQPVSPAEEAAAIASILGGA